jgi:hypothetical protein
MWPVMTEKSLIQIQETSLIPQMYNTQEFRVGTMGCPSKVSLCSPNCMTIYIYYIRVQLTGLIGLFCRYIITTN